jgi:hypothetical protein
MSKWFLFCQKIQFVLSTHHSQISISQIQNVSINATKSVIFIEPYLINIERHINRRTIVWNTSLSFDPSLPINSQQNLMPYSIIFFYLRKRSARIYSNIFSNSTTSIFSFFWIKVPKTYIHIYHKIIINFHNHFSFISNSTHFIDISLSLSLNIISQMMIEQFYN